MELLDYSQNDTLIKKKTCIRIIDDILGIARVEVNFVFYQALVHVGLRSADKLKLLLEE